MSETKLEVLTNLSISDVHRIQTMIEFFETRIRDDDEDMYRALCVTTECDAYVSHEEMESVADYLSDLYNELDDVDDVGNECSAIITIEQHYTAYDKNSYRRIDSVATPKLSVNNFTFACVINDVELNVEVALGDMIWITTMSLADMTDVILSSPDDDFKRLHELEDSNDIIEFDLSDNIAYYRYYTGYNPDGAELVRLLDNLFVMLGIELLDIEE